MLKEALFLLITISTNTSKNEPKQIIPMGNFPTLEECESQLVGLAKNKNEILPGYKLVTNLGQLFAVSNDTPDATTSTWYGCIEVKNSYWK